KWECMPQCPQGRYGTQQVAQLQCPENSYGLNGMQRFYHIKNTLNWMAPLIVQYTDKKGMHSEVTIISATCTGFLVVPFSRKRKKARYRISHTVNAHVAIRYSRKNRKSRKAVKLKMNPR